MNCTTYVYLLLKSEKNFRGNSYRVNSDISNSCGVSDMWQMLSGTPGDKEGKEMKKSFTTSQVKMITRTLIIDKRFEM